MAGHMGNNTDSNVGNGSVVHIGFHKTATTSAQAALEALAPTGYIGRPFSPELEAALMRLATTGDTAPARALTPPGPILVSDERFTPVCWNIDYVDAERLAGALADWVGPARIVMTVRDQRRLVRSYWAWSVRMGNRQRFGAFLRDEIGRMERWAPGSMAFSATTALFERHFPEVVVLPMESVIADPKVLGRALGVDDFDDLPRNNVTDDDLIPLYRYLSFVGRSYYSSKSSTIAPGRRPTVKTLQRQLRRVTRRTGVPDLQALRRAGAVHPNDWDRFLELIAEDNAALTEQGWQLPGYVGAESPPS